MGIMSGVIILSWVQESTDHYAVLISNRTKNSLSVGYFPFSKRPPEELKSERDKVNTLLTRLESQENALASERQQHQATRETLQQRLEQAVADAQARTGELALERDRVSSLTARLESQEKASSEQLVRMGSEIASLTDRCTQLENQRDDARLETMGEKETVAALRGEAEALKRQNQSLMAALSGNKQTGGQNA